MSGLTRNISIEQFDNGYYYVGELRTFAKEIGVKQVSRLRKDQLEDIIRFYLQTGKIKQLTVAKSAPDQAKDSDLGLKPDLPVKRYTNNKETKDFIKQEAQKKVPGLKPKSGAMYRLNRWRESQIESGLAITYGDIVDQYIALSSVKGSFERVPHGRYINFVADYLANEPDASRIDAIKHWKALKQMDIPKTYAAWKKHNRSL